MPYSIQLKRLFSTGEKVAILSFKNIFPLETNTTTCTYCCSQHVSKRKYYKQTAFGIQKLTVRSIYNNPAQLQVSGKKEPEKTPQILHVAEREYFHDEWTNLSPKILDAVEKKLHLRNDHPISLMKEVIVQHFYKNYTRGGNPIFAVFDNLSPVVTPEQNFDQLLIPSDHVSRRKSDNYYINKSYMLRAHTSAHEHDLIKSGLNAFITVGDVYRRDTIDSTHFPVFHQLEGVRLFNAEQLFATSDDKTSLSLFEKGEKLHEKQACHTMEAAKLVEYNLKKSIESCMLELFGKDVQCRWIDAYFPFTHPSFELEIKYNGEWVEMLGCGILQQEILNKAGAQHHMAWAFGLGLERLAMKLFDIPDIRYFWSNDEAVLSQFRGLSDAKNIKFKPVTSKQPALYHDISFWVPKEFCVNDFYDLVRNISSDIVEQIAVMDKFTNPKTDRTSYCFRVFYRHTSRPLNKLEVSEVHSALKEAAVKYLDVDGRW
ncbi:phenylalanine--tRNA ligase, mitochondrial-like [Clavelina lepadiformis]|uniref:phenylalanine--tRNA ligase, mitochondrial-like n=1 Tax=Clavelina lepadiformis TaxID=159417 RepID=UPI0040413F0F